MLANDQYMFPLGGGTANDVSEILCWLQDNTTSCKIIRDREKYEYVIIKNDTDAMAFKLKWL